MKQEKSCYEVFRESENLQLLDDTSYFCISVETQSGCG